MALTRESIAYINFPGVGSQPLHANFHADGDEYFFAYENKIGVFVPGTSSHTTGRKVRDITLTNHPTNLRIWGLTKTTGGHWVTLTRDTGTGYIGTLRSFQEDGTAVSTRRVPDVITGINNVATQFRAPKTISEVDGNLFVRVVRGVTGNMRFIKFDSALQIQDDDLVLNSATPASLYDATSNGYQNIILASGFVSSSVARTTIHGMLASNAEIVSDLETRVTTSDTSLLGLAAHGDRLYVADGSNRVHILSGLPERPSTPITPPPVIPPGGGPSTGTHSGGLFFIGLEFLNNFSTRDFRRRQRF